jgi:hypothetical protein
MPTAAQRAPQAPHYGYTGEDDPPTRDVASWEHPSCAINLGVTDGSTDVLTAEQVEKWTTERYLVIDSIWPQELIAAAAAQFEAIYPSPGPETGSAEAIAAAGPTQEVGGFPWGPRLSAANHIPVHPRILRAVSQLLGTEELYLTQSGGGAKYGTGGHEKPRLSDSSASFGEVGDQPIHKDFGNNIVLVPGIDTPAEAVNCILYYTHASDSGGSTAFVPYSDDLYDVDEAGKHVNFIGE